MVGYTVYIMDAPAGRYIDEGSQQDSAQGSFPFQLVFEPRATWIA